MTGEDIMDEENIEDEQEFMMRGVMMGGKSGSDLVSAMENFLESDNQLGKSRLSHEQALAIPLVKAYVDLMPEFDEKHKEMIENLIHDVLLGSTSIEGKSREEAVKILTRGRVGDESEDGKINIYTEETNDED